jgi:hypothetical protein
MFRNNFSTSEYIAILSLQRYAFFAFFIFKLGYSITRGTIMIPDELIKTNKAITKLRYEFEEYDSAETKEVLDVLQFHMFMVISYFNKPELDANDVKKRLIEKLAGAF